MCPALRGRLRTLRRITVRYRDILAIPAVFAALFLVFCSVGESSAQSNRTVLVKGANAMATLVNKLARDFDKKAPDATVVVSGGGTEKGFEALFEHAADLVMASRKILPKEQQGAALAEVKPTHCLTIYGGVAIIVHPDNPVRELTLEQLRGIFSGEITNWSDVGGTDGSIHIITGRQLSGVTQYVRDKILNKGFFPTDVQTRAYFHHIVRDVNRSKGLGIGYADFAKAKDSVEKGLVKMVGVQTNDESPAVWPTDSTIKSSEYPLLMPLFLYWDEKRVKDVTRTFVGYVARQRGGRVVSE